MQSYPKIDVNLSSGLLKREHTKKIPHFKVNFRQKVRVK